MSIGKRAASARFRRCPWRCEKAPESAMVTAQRSPLERKEPSLSLDSGAVKVKNLLPQTYLKYLTLGQLLAQ